MDEKSQPHLKDALTGVYSRAAFQERLAEEIALSRRYGHDVSLIVMDLDHFKSINDAYGHRRGDRALVEFAMRVQSVLRQSDPLFRYGGDEFTVILPRTDLHQAEPLAERVLAALRQGPLEGNPPIHATASMGIAAFPADGDTPEALFERADARHYLAKRGGRDRVVLADQPDQTSPAFGVARLIERDEALSQLHDFFRSLPHSGTGLLTIHGEPGTGQSRFLQEAGKVARMQGLLLLPLTGRPETRPKPYGAIMEALREWGRVPSPVAGFGAFVEALQHRLEEKGAEGLAITVDGLSDLDDQTVLLLRDLLASGELPLFAIAVAVEAGPNQRAALLDADLKREVHLEPLSLRGVHLFLRSALHLEPEESFVQWLYDATRGLPVLVDRALRELSQRNVVQRTAEGGSVVLDYHSIPLAELLLAWRQAPGLNLPSAVTSFVGREGELQALKERMLGRRLITVLGPGGTGKTRLAVQVATEVGRQFRHGVGLVHLAPVATPDRLAQAIATALGVVLQPQPGVKEQLLAYLRPKEMLLVLDNFEHLTDGADLVAEILEEAPQVRVLVTTRERLRLPGESFLELGGLSVPESADLPTAALSTSVQLFVERARQLDEGFRLHASTVTPVVRICQMVEGMPLAIELAAAWVRMLSCQEIAEGIGRSLGFLDAAATESPGRYRSLRSAFRHSWELLSPEERSAFARLSVFRGGFDREGAEKVAGARFSVLASLMDKSLIRRVGTGRYEMHEMLREYGAAILSEAESLEATRRHVEFYLDLADKVSGAAGGAEQPELRERLKLEQENLRAAIGWAIHAGESEIALRLGISMRFWLLWDQTVEGANWLQAALKVDPEARPTRFRAAGLNTLAWLKHQQGNRQEAYLLSEEALEIYRELQDRKGQAESLYSLGALSSRLGNYATAKRQLTECLVIQRELGDPMALSAALAAMGVVAFDRGDDATSLACLEEALEIRRELKDDYAVSMMLSNIGTLLLRMGENDRADSYLNESLQLMRSRGLGGQGIPLHGLGDLALLRGQDALAHERLAEALVAKQKSGLHAHLGHTLFSLSVAARRMGDLAEARRWVREGFTSMVQVAHQQAYPSGLIFAAAVLCAEGQPERAARLVGAAESALTAMGGVFEAVPAFEHGELTRALAERLDPERFAACRSEGRGHSLTEAMEYAQAE